MVADMAWDGEMWYKHELNASELTRFIENARNGKPGNALIGRVSDFTKNKVKELTGTGVTKIILEGTSIAHVDDPKHKLNSDDIEKCVQVINNPENIKLLEGTDSQGLILIEFEGNINGPIFFVETVHKTYKGWLSLKTAYRQKK